VRQIGEIAAKLISDPKRLVAAANEEARPSFEGGLPKGLDDNPPIAAAVGGDPVRELVARKEASAETPASFSGGQYCVETGGRPVLDTPLTMSRNMRVTSPNGLPRPVARIFLVTIDGVRVHPPAPKSIPARKTRAMNMASVMMF
jgi:hypothetical protein